MSDIPMGRVLIGIGLLLIAAGLVWTFGERFGLGRLPGDIAVQRPGVTFYFPLATSIIVSVILTLLLWFFQGRR
jgi:hypothetical protein